VSVLQHGDNPVVEPDELVLRVELKTAQDKAGRQEAPKSFHNAHREAMHKFRADLDDMAPEIRRESSPAVPMAAKAGQVSS
jgi:hypothetical protein